MRLVTRSLLLVAAMAALGVAASTAPAPEALRFWPEWPATGTHSATFSLIGFTKAYGELSGCP